MEIPDHALLQSRRGPDPGGSSLTALVQHEHPPRQAVVGEDFVVFQGGVSSDIRLDGQEERTLPDNLAHGTAMASKDFLLFEIAGFRNEIQADQLAKGERNNEKSQLIRQFTKRRRSLQFEIVQKRCGGPTLQQKTRFKVFEKLKVKRGYDDVRRRGF